MTQPEMVLVKDKAALASSASARIAQMIRDCVDGQGTCTLALAGGETPRGVYEALARDHDLPWDKVTLFFGDERCVSPEHPDSNYLMVKQSLLDPLGERAPAIHRMQGELADRDEAAAGYARKLPSSLDIVLLGMGPDGHTASLFPGDGAWTQTQRLVVPVFGAKPPPWRLSIAPAVIEAARQVVVLALGESKAEKLREVLTEPVDIYKRPIQLALGGVWFVDAGAVSRLPASMQPQPGAGGA